MKAGDLRIEGWDGGFVGEDLGGEVGDCFFEGGGGGGGGLGGGHWWGVGEGREGGDGVVDGEGEEVLRWELVR